MMSEPAAKRAHYATSSTTLLASHPNGVRPYGNSAMGYHHRDKGLGYFAQLPDEVLLTVLKVLPVHVLLKLAQCSRWLYCFVNHDDVWREKLLDRVAGSGFMYTESWKQTYMNIYHPRTAIVSSMHFDSVFSDHLFEPWVAHSLAIQASWLKAETVQRCSADISTDDFIRQYDQTSTPAVLTNYTSRWPAYATWSHTELIKRYPSAPLNAGAATLTFEQYFAYAAQQRDERPLYVFDKHFTTKCPSIEDDYSPPSFAANQHDLLALLGAQRPAYRWLICGPERSGSSWHVDPNATSAWNGLIKGKKRWIFCPPGCTPPGVFPSPDGAAVATPISITEWMKDYYEELVASGIAYLEVTQHPGDLVFVPSGWWHMVLNLEDTIALTQNYISASNLSSALRFMRDKPDQVSGTEQGAELYARFSEALQRHRPELWQRVQPSLVNKPSLWAKMTTADSDGDKRDKCDDIEAAASKASSDDGTPQTNSFSFGFA
eukprot:TRINITY_DN12084_c3_g2_i12.p1 TRINITY_DN12084_c3_g2~~TRINITY_DN12084_c3_g2_i12.p1  ORF type:complete len:489 (+),score=85.72 TRINITY_DN12084_c3_g2_i12:118-1584(+)